MNNLTSNIILVLIAISLVTAFYIAGMMSVNPEIKRVYVIIDSEYLQAAREYHGLKEDDIFYYNETLCFRRDGKLCVVNTGGFKAYYNEKHLGLGGKKNANN
jgi:hypothetical protein